MKIAISAFGDVDRHVKGRRELELADGATVATVLAELGISPTAQLTVGINGQLVALDSPLRDGDKVMLVTPMEGGSAHA